MSRSPTVAIIVAGGRGTRMAQSEGEVSAKTDLPKQYQMLGDKCVLQLTIDAFTSHGQIDQVQVVIHKDDHETYASLVTEHDKLLAPVTGGASRQQSVLCGLNAVAKFPADTRVLIHDAARPFVEPQTISRVLEAVAPDQGAIAALRVADTLKSSDHTLNVIETVPRHNLHSAQTPQGFLHAEIARVHADAARRENQEFTDDASMFEAAGKSVMIVPAPASNFKITTNEDLTMARLITKPHNYHADIRTGTGYDVHAFEEGDSVTLCGLKIPFDKKLKGHSDADVALHALTDALLGTIGAGDIGTHFPPSDDQWKNTASHVFIEAALAMVADKSGIINNVDIAIICEEPKIGPHRIAMQKHLAQLCGLNIERVSIKATTNEKLGFLGRGEGIAALASATVSFGERQ